MHQSELLKNNQSQQNIMLYKITHDLIAWRRLAICSRNVAIHITRDYIPRQTKNLAFTIKLYFDTKKKNLSRLEVRFSKSQGTKN